MVTLQRTALIALGIVIGAGTVGYGLQQAQPVPQREVCSMPGTGAYSPGAIVPYQGTLYRCFYVSNDNVEPDGVRWIKMLNSAEPKDPGDGR